MDEQAQEQVRNWLKRADEYIRAAEHEFKGGFYARSISTSYYAMFYAATAALASIGVERAKHSGVVSAFGEYFIKTTKISPELGRALSRTMEDREDSDYAEIPSVNETLAQERLSEARHFVKVVSQHLKDQGLRTE
jgi:hypothetical protein